MSIHPSLYTIPAGVSFLDVLAQGLYDRVGDRKDRLADMRILLPTRRGCRGLREAFLRYTEGAPIILPRMHAIGDVDQDEISIIASSQEKLVSIKPAISSLHRSILLARLVRKVPGFSFSEEQAFGLADSLGHFIDQVHTEGLSLDHLEALVPETLAAHWNINLQFLTILKDAWPTLLESYGLIDGGLRRRLLMEAMNSYWQDHPPQTPVIVAGTTGSIPATADILDTVLSLPQGEVILPGLDQILEAQSWESVSDGHPQYTLKKLIDRLQIDRAHIAHWPDMTHTPNADRLQLVSELMRPADTVHHWQNLNTLSQASLKGLTQCVCDSPDEEAHVIALIMREVLEDPHQNKTAALITPDRFLGRRVEAILKRWDIQINDSAGIPLPESDIGRFFIALLNVMETKQAPVALLALLKHPLCSAGMSKGWGNALAKRLEIDGCIRGNTPAQGIDTLLQRTQDDQIKDNLSHLHALLMPLKEHIEKSVSVEDLKMLLTLVIQTGESLSETNEGKDTLWTGEAGEAASLFFSEILELMTDMPSLSFKEWTSILIQQMNRIAVRPKFGAHPRLSIYGQIEARLVQADVVILGSLNEGTWPSEPASDPWMSRPMRREMGLPSPEQAITLAAHDFAQGMSAPHVFITRAKKSGGNPTVPSRWLQRLETVCQSAGLEDITQRGEHYRHWAHALNACEETLPPLTRPAPKPPLNTRPDTLYVTDIEKLICDPYAIYAKRILKLKPLEPLEEDLSAKDRGTFIHAVLDRFVTAHPRDLLETAHADLLVMGKDILEDTLDTPEVWASWWPRFERMATWFIAHETDWRAQGYTFVAGEEKASLTIEGVKIVGRCDRIDRDSDGDIALIDYKTGGQYAQTDMLRGFLPQLPVEGLMIEQGAFETRAPADISYLGYWMLSGLKEGGDVSHATQTSKTSVEAIMDSARTGLPALLIAFQDPTMPYLSLPFAGKEPRYQDYAHLARVSEWSTGEEDEST